MNDDLTELLLECHRLLTKDTDRIRIIRRRYKMNRNEKIVRVMGVLFLICKLLIRK